MRLLLRHREYTHKFEQDSHYHRPMMAEIQVMQSMPLKFREIYLHIKNIGHSNIRPHFQSGKERIGQ